MTGAVTAQTLSMRVPAALDGERLDRAVATVCGVSRREAAAAVATGGVHLDGRVVDTRAARVAEGQHLDVTLPVPHDDRPGPEPDVALTVVDADPWLIVVDKPAGLVVHPGAGHRTGTLVGGLLARFPELAGVGDPARPGIVHRLDAGTSGLLVVARRPEAYEALVGQLRARTAGRRYLALVWGHVESDAGLVDAPVGRSDADPTHMSVTTRGRPARTGYQVVSRHDRPRPTTLVECRLETGRTHQIRVHLAAIGHPVVGDDRYGGDRPGLGLARLFLHAHRLELDHPQSGDRRGWSSPLPPELERTRDLVAEP